jgi:hypothetical protein
MTQSLDIQELALVLAVERQDPSLLTPDFLRYSGIIPEDWELARQPVRTPQAAQVSYQNGISLVAYADRTVFVETFGDRPAESIEVPSIAQRYSEVLRNLDFRAIGINFRGHVLFPGTDSGAHEYLCKTLLNPGSWQSLGTAPMRAGLNLVYTLEQSTLNLSIQEAMLQLPEQERVPVVVFGANFETAIQPEKAQHLQLNQALERWQKDLDLYRQVVNQFLQQQQQEYLIPMPSLPV